MTTEQAINRVDLGNCMLFTGSGFSRGAKGSDPKEELQTAWDLAQKMYVECTGTEDVRKTLNEMLMITSENKQYLK